MKKVAMNKNLSIITLNINGLNAPIKRHRVAERIKTMTCTYADNERPTSEENMYTD